MQPLPGNQRPDLLTALMKMSLVLCLPRKMHLCRSSSNVPRLPSFLDMLQTLTFCLLLRRCKIPCACHAKRRLNVQKWSPELVCVHFFDISTSKSGPLLWCFVHFHFQMCFAPQRHALFRHRNFQKWSDPLVFCPF